MGKSRNVRISTPLLTLKDLKRFLHKTGKAFNNDYGLRNMDDSRIILFWCPTLKREYDEN